MIIGIDPGLSGAIAIIWEDKIELFDMPILPDPQSKKRNRIDGMALSKILSPKGFQAHYVNIELVHSMPKQGVASSFRFGEGYGIVIGVVQCLNLPMNFVSPAKWKRKFNLIGKPKDASRALAIQQYPELQQELKLKKYIDRADALWIGKFYG